MTYVIGKKSVVNTHCSTVSVKVVQNQPSLGYGFAYEWLRLDRVLGTISINAQKLKLIRKDSQKRVVDFVCKELLSHDSTYKGSGAIKNTLLDYDNFIRTIKSEVKKHGVSSDECIYIRDVFDVEVVISNPLYFL